MARPRKPSHLKLIAGTEKQCRVNEDEPRPPVEIPPVPPQFGAKARSAWDRVAPILVRMGVLTAMDALALEQMCETYAVIRHCQAVLLEYGDLTYESGKDGACMRRAHPEVAILADADRRFRAYLNDFGMTPASRSKVKAEGQASDPLDAYFAG